MRNRMTRGQALKMAGVLVVVVLVGVAILCLSFENRDRSSPHERAFVETPEPEGANGVARHQAASSPVSTPGKHPAPMPDNAVAPSAPDRSVPKTVQAPAVTRAARIRAARAEGMVIPDSWVDTGGDPYADAETVMSRVGPEIDGVSERQRILRTDAKYPLVYVEETVRIDPRTGNKQARIRREMVADHIVVKLRDGFTEADLKQLNRKYGGTIRRKLRITGHHAYLVALSDVDLSSVQQAVSNYGDEDAVDSAGPDHIVRPTATPDDPFFPGLWGMRNTGQGGGPGTVTAGSNTVEGWSFVFAGSTPETGVTGILHDCGLGYPSSFPSGVSGNIALISRGEISFKDKVANAMDAGAAAALIYNNAGSVFAGTLQTPGTWIPALALGNAEGSELLDSAVGESVTLVYYQSIDADIDAEEAWEYTVGSSNVVVGVVDTGIDYTHPDLVGNMWTNPGEIPGNGQDDDANGYVDDVYGWDFCNDDNDPKDDHYHGTHCAGTIGGVGNNGVGVPGVCWDVSVAALKFISASGAGYSSDAAEAVSYATDKGFDLISNSWGGSGYDSLLESVIADAGATGILFVAAAGNSSGNNDAYPVFPASYPCSNIIAVAATDGADELASFSCYGLERVDLGAPGVGIYSTFPTYMTDAMDAAGHPTNYAAISGTSMATPHVAGVCALVRAFSPSLSADDLMYAVLAGGDYAPALDGFTVTAGRLNACNSLTVVSSAVVRAKRDSLTVLEDGSAGSQGNADGFVNPGERLALSVTMENIGMLAATAVSATLMTDDPKATIVSNTVAYGTIGARSEATSGTKYLVDIDGVVDTPHEVELALQVSDATGPVATNTFTVTVYTTSEISGTVMYNGSPLDGATVTYEGPVDGVVTTAANGTYTFTTVDGTTTLRATYDGFYGTAPQSVTTPGDKIVDFSFVDASISGQVVRDDTGVPVPDVAVDYAGAFYGSVTTDPSGTFDITHVFGRPAMMRLNVSTTMDGDLYSAEPLLVAIPPDADALELRLKRAGALQFYHIEWIDESGWALDISSNGMVVGGPGNTTSPGDDAWIWQDGIVTNLGVGPNSVPDVHRTRARACSDSGYVAIERFGHGAS